LCAGAPLIRQNLNATNPIGTVKSIEHTLRSLEKLAAEQQNRVARIEKQLAGYQSQANRPFEHEERLKQLLARQAEINSSLDLDKGDQQGADSGLDSKNDDLESRRSEIAKMAETYMRGAKTASREMPIVERPAPQTGPVTGRAVASAYCRFNRCQHLFRPTSNSSRPRCANRRTLISALSTRPGIDRQRPRSRKVTSQSHARRLGSSHPSKLTFFHASLPENSQ
jgi:hypothetical protein